MIGKLKELLKLHSPRRFAGYVVLGVVALLSCAPFALQAQQTTDLPWNFHGNGGKVNGKDTETIWMANNVSMFETKGLVLTPPDPSKKCIGWYSAVEGGTKYCTVNGAIINYKRDSYARWVESRYPLVFNSNNGQNAVQEQWVVKSVPVTLMNTGFTRSNHRLAGWSLDPNATEWSWADQQTDVVLDDYRDYEDSSYKDEYDEEANPVKLYAVWVKQFKISFQKNGGSGENMPDLILDENVPKNLPKCTFTPPAGSKFDGWSSSYGLYDDGDEVTYQSSIWTTTSDRFVAQWTPISYKVSFHLNTTAPAIGSMSDVVVDYGVWQALPQCGFTRFGYSFAGWAKSPTGDVAYSDKAVVQNLSDKDGDVVDLYARWKPINYFVRFDANGGVGGSMGVMACEYDKSYTLTKNTYTREGSDFLGWSTNGSTSVAFEDGANFSNLSTVANSTNVLRAVWSNYPYQIAFDGNGGDGEILNISCEYGTVYQLPSNAFTRIGYIFTGWATNATTAAVYAEGAAVSNLTLKVEETVRFYAAWRPITYRILFDADGGEGVMPPMTNVYDVAANLPPNAFSDIGMVFTGWALAPSGEVHYADCAQILNLTTEEDDEIVFYASWRQDINDLNAALDNNKLIFVRNGIEENVTVTNDASFVNGSCVKAVSGPATTDQSGIKIVLETPGELQFSWKVANDQEFENKNQGWHMRVYEVVGDSRLSMYDCAQPKGQPNMVSWSNAVISVTNETAMIEVLVDWYEGNSSAPYPYVLLDKVRFSTGDNPEPEPEDAPVINGAASVEGGRFRVSFAADGRFKYELIKTESLSPVNWQSFSPQLFLTPDADGTVSFEPEMESSKPNMFYRVKVLKKD